jgi:hypothetical protein
MGHASLYDLIDRHYDYLNGSLNESQTRSSELAPGEEYGCSRCQGNRHALLNRVISQVYNGGEK